MNKHGVVSHVLQSHPAPGRLQITQGHVHLARERLPAEEGQTVARAGGGARGVTEHFIIVLRAVVDPVTHVLGPCTDAVSTTAVETGTRVAVTVSLVLPTRAVVHTIAAQEDRQAVAVPSALEVVVRARGRLAGEGVVHTAQRHRSVRAVEVDDGWRRDCGGVQIIRGGCTLFFIRPVHTVSYAVVGHPAVHTLKPTTTPLHMY